MAELNIIHPFREGNGRSIREFIRLMAKRNGYDLNWGNVGREELLEASKQQSSAGEQLMSFNTQ